MTGAGEHWHPDAQEAHGALAEPTFDAAMEDPSWGGRPIGCRRGRYVQAA